MYFSDRESGPQARSGEEIGLPVWQAIISLINKDCERGCYGLWFPETCSDNSCPIGTDVHAMGVAVCAEIPGLSWPLNSWDPQPESSRVLDLLEFCWRHVAEPIQDGYHSYFKHYHLQFDAPRGQARFRSAINTYFQRNGHIWDMEANGQIVRIGPPVLRNNLVSADFRTFDSHLNELLEIARRKFLSRHAEERIESLEKLWDAWERMKTVLPGKDKKESIQTLLLNVAPGDAFREVLSAEAKALTDIGNRYHIRHFETDRVPIADETHRDYLFHRMFAMIMLLVRGLQF